MAYEHKEGQGSLFINDKKDNERQPDYTGTINVGGKTMRLAAWKKVSQSGSEYISVQYSELRTQQEQRPEPEAKDWRSHREPQQGQYAGAVPPMPRDLPF